MRLLKPIKFRCKEQACGILSLLVGLLSGCAADDRDPPVDPGAPPPAAFPESSPTCSALGRETPGPLQLDTVATGLDVPWDIAFAPDGRIFIVERSGRVSVLRGDGLGGGVVPETWTRIPVAQVAEAGLLGIDLPPDHERTGDVFVALTYQAVPDGMIRRVVAAVGRRMARLFDEAAGQVWFNRVVRISESDSGPPEVVPVLDGIPSGAIHAGGALRFGPDGFLYLGTGDGGTPARAADPGNLGGKILRFDPYGPEPDGAPDPTTLILASGFRNSQGLAWLPDSDTLLAIDHGPTGLEAEARRQGGDELNRVVAGADYGWPEATGYETTGSSRPALLTWTPALAPAGMTVVSAPGSAWHGDVFVTALRGTELRRIVLEGLGAESVLCEESLLAGTHGRLRAVRQAPDGALYVGTSNRDQRGTPGPADDLLLRIELPPPPVDGAPAALDEPGATSVTSAIPATGS